MSAQTVVFFAIIDEMPLGGLDYSVKSILVYYKLAYR
jgi:hypothetical protein